MAKSVDVDGLALELTRSIKEYTDEVAKAIENEVNETSKEIRNDIKNGSPEDTGEYKKGWRRKKSTKGGEIEITIYNRDKPELTHLLEIGHAIAEGGRVPAYPHIRNPYDEKIPAMNKRIDKIIKNGG